ncbi:AAA family ATPase [Nocardia sp. NPDC051030]|uniref:AAA family ATPase n=1 Tax=Nocardia sp. NPDC051030 TaxID=3155162 RepID=UPI003425E836
MERILVSGISGAGKTTLAVRLAELLRMPRYELDALHHGPGWVKRDAFEDEVAEFSDGERWVTEDQYKQLVGSVLWSRADTLVWLDLPRSTIMPRVIRRSVARAVSRRELWNGNRESVRNWIEPGHPMRWAWSQHANRRLDMEYRIPQFPHLTVVRLRTAPEVREWVQQLRP